MSEINPAAEALVEDVGRRMTGGALLIIDYGFPQAEFYHAQRSEGTLMGHYRHRAHADPFLWPGLSDLTAHVDFTAIALAGERAGLQVAGYAPQAAFLLGCGILDRLRDMRRSGVGGVSARSGRGAEADVAGRNGRIVQGAGAGERAKTSRGRDSRWSDRSHRL